MQKKENNMFYVFLADGFEEAEALVPLDLLRRAGVDVYTVGITGPVVCSSKKIKVFADLTPEEISFDQCEGVMLPGGMPGTENLYRSSFVQDAVSACVSQKKLLCAICAAPSVPGRMGLLRGKRAVCFPGFETKLTGAVVCDEPVVKDGMIITAKGAGCVFPFSHCIISALRDKNTADRIIKEIQYAPMHEAQEV